MQQDNVPDSKSSMAGGRPEADDSQRRWQSSIVRRDVLKLATFAAASFAWTRGWAAGSSAGERKWKWVVFYGETADEEELAAYDIVILDPLFHGSAAAIASRGARVCAYLSLGEIRASNMFFDRVDPASLLEENPAWPGTRRIDVRSHAWNALILEAIIPSIIAKGFTGLMLDTLDTPPYLEQLDPVGNRGMKQAAITLVQAIRRSYPKTMVIMNRGYALLSNVLNHVDGVIAESLLTTPDGDRSGRFKWNDSSAVALQLSMLAPAKARRPRVPILSLDYWDPEDVEGVRKIYTCQRRLGHSPYVATPVLDRVIPEPNQLADLTSGNEQW